MPKQKIKKEKQPEEDDNPQSKEYKVTAKHAMNQYNRNKILKMITEDGSGPTTCNAIAIKYSKIDKRCMENFVNKHAESSQKYVGQEANSLEFDSLDNWVSYFKSMEYNVNCGNELPLVLKALAETEKCPESCKDTINIKKLYEWLSDVMMGLAPRPLNVQSEIFLMENFMELMEKLNTPESKEELSEMEKALSEKANVVEFLESDEISTFAKSINPLELNIPEEK